MARKKRSSLPAVTDADLLLRPEMVRFTPNGGRAWKCAYCDRFACDQSLKGVFLCRCHGGSTPRQRDPYQQYLHKLSTGEKLRTPGRPLKHGRYSRLPRINLFEFVTEYRQRKAQQDAKFHARCQRYMQADRRLLAKLKRGE